MRSIWKKLLPAAGCMLALCLMAGCAGTAADDEAGSAAAGNEVLSAQTASGESGETAEAVGTDTADAPAVEADPVVVDKTAEAEPVYVEKLVLDGLELEYEAVPLAASAAASSVTAPVASGTAVKTGGGAEIDYSNTKDGYVMARFAGANDKRLRVQVTGPTTTYTYDLPTGAWNTFPLSDGNGSYKVTVLQNTEGKKYAVLASVTTQVTLSNEFAPFLRPNQYVNYSSAPNSVQKAKELTGSISEPLKKVAAVYDYVVKNLTYDKEKASTVQSGYLPVLDSVLSGKKGICFDYAALMTGMLRSQGVPCKLVVGYAGTAYHAWVNVWTEETGWVDGVIFFDGTSWQRMDPTFASSGKSSEAIMKYIGDGKNYTTKYLY